MSRFGPRDPFFVAMQQALSDDRMKRVLAIDVRYGDCGGPRLPISAPIIDHDPGDEDDGPRSTR